MPSTHPELRYLTTEELTRLRRYAEARATCAKKTGAVTATRARALLDTLLSSGLRASEAAALRIGDCLLAKVYQESQRKQAAPTRWPKQSAPSSRIAMASGLPCA